VPGRPGRPARARQTERNRYAGAMSTDNQTNKLLLVIIAILLPPVAVGLKRGIGLHLVLSIVLTLCFYLPGLLHALWVVLT